MLNRQLIVIALYSIYGMFELLSPIRFEVRFVFIRFLI